MRKHAQVPEHPAPALGGRPETSGADRAWYRLWPPVALGLPLLSGLTLTALVGDPWELPTWRRPLGWGLVAGFAVWNAWGLRSLARHRTGLLPGQPTNVLVVDGPYRFSRNPLYLGMATLYVGLGLLAPSLWALLLTPLAVAAVEWGAIRPEEMFLRQQFGEEYEKYARHTRRWI